METEFRKFLSECLVCFKHPGYKQEDEWRAIMFGDESLEVSFRASGGRVIPYVEIDVTEDREDGSPRLALRSITYGPTLDPEGTDLFFLSSCLSWRSPTLVDPSLPICPVYYSLQMGGQYNPD